MMILKLKGNDIELYIAL